MKSDGKNAPLDNVAFQDAIAIIEHARENAFRAVNHELISMYWEIGHYISKKVVVDNWGKFVVQEFSRFIQSRFVGIKGFPSQNVWRMQQFYETYAENEKLSTLSRELSWSNNVLIMVAAKTNAEREFYLLLTRQNNYSKRELERQIDSGLYERTMISAEKNQLLIARNAGLTARVCGNRGSG